MEFMELMKERRSVRAYADKPVDRALMDEMLPGPGDRFFFKKGKKPPAAAGKAPSVSEISFPRGQIPVPGGRTDHKNRPGGIIRYHFPDISLQLRRSLLFMAGKEKEHRPSGPVFQDLTGGSFKFKQLLHPLSPSACVSTSGDTLRVGRLSLFHPAGSSVLFSHCFWTTVMPGSTEWVSQTLPPITQLSPIYTSPPRIVAPA